MKTILAAVALATATLTAPAFADNFGVSVGMGDNGYYGHIDIGNAPQPVVYNTQPVIIQQQPVYVEPVYMRVPVAHQHNWRHHCGYYNACGRPVYFVKDTWYQTPIGRTTRVPTAMSTTAVATGTVTAAAVLSAAKIAVKTGVRTATTIASTEIGLAPGRIPHPASA